MDFCHEILNIKAVICAIANQKYKNTRTKIYPQFLGDDGLHIFCKVKLFGTPCRALIDTGASKTVFSEQLLQKFKELTPVAIDNNETSGIGKEAIEASAVEVENIEIGRLQLPTFIAGVIDMTHVNAIYLRFNLPPIDLILGSDILMKTQAKIDYRSMFLVLRTDTPLLD